ncbi:hypothetical protein AJ78_01001 [Emergomyces pasteurianus Ep9510]|uniref:PBP domain-containing protein n=1 Tax=Emergomyces pasteurianus Ep9510 TaxID=1447872 RepID=A0A1J9PT23_9EURO|nr:hypothetical protein AJ78_01001 [Emergomyces pasteurianus Ep9510]
MRSLMIKKILALTYLLRFTATAAHVIEPEQVYDGGFKENSTIRLRIGNGGGGQCGMIGELANAFIRHCVEEGAEPFQVAWYKSDTTESINYLKTGDVDVAITYSIGAERAAVQGGIATEPIYCAWSDHFMLVGPQSNPANLDEQSDIFTMISRIVHMAENEIPGSTVRFLSRYDKSATNIKESELFIAIGQVPWASRYSPWYHQYVAYPMEALRAAAYLKEYTLTDRGTYLSVDKDVRDRLAVYVVGSDDPDDPLLNPAHLIVGKRAKDADLAKEFAEWVVSAAGQSVVTEFKKEGEPLYSGAPPSGYEKGTCFRRG